MPLSEILALIAFAIKEAPEILHVIVTLLKIVTGDDVDAKLDSFDKEAAIKLEVLLRTARSTSAAVASFKPEDYGLEDVTLLSDKKFADVVAAVKAVADEFGLKLGQGKLETIAQAGYGNANISGDVQIVDDTTIEVQRIGTKA